MPGEKSPFTEVSRPPTIGAQHASQRMSMPLMWILSFRHASKTLVHFALSWCVMAARMEGRPPLRIVISEKLVRDVVSPWIQYCLFTEVDGGIDIQSSSALLRMLIPAAKSRKLPACDHALNFVSKEIRGRRTSASSHDFYFLLF